MVCCCCSSGQFTADQKVSQACLAIFKRRKVSAPGSCTPHGRYRPDPRAEHALTASEGSPFLSLARAVGQGSWLLLALASCLSASASIPLHRAYLPHLQPHVLQLHKRFIQHHSRLLVSRLLPDHSSHEKTRRRQSLGGHGTLSQYPCLTLPASPSLRSRADPQDIAFEEAESAISQSIVRAVENAFTRPNSAPDTLRGVILRLRHDQIPPRNIPDPVSETTPPTITMAETMSPIGIANVCIAAMQSNVPGLALTAHSSPTSATRLLRSAVQLSLSWSLASLV